MADDEVEELLRVTQDEVLLKLSVDSHTSRSSNDYLDPDLHSRFLALKSKKKNKDEPRRSRSPTKSKPKSKRDEENLTPDDLMLRFAALKSSNTTSSSSTSSVSVPGGIGEEDDDEEGGEDAEVEKLIQWAMDAARLDPSPPSDDEDDDVDDDDSPKVVKH